MISHKENPFLFLIFIYLTVCGLSCGMWDLLLQRTNSLVVKCGLTCSVACGTLLPQPGIEPTSPALQGRFLISGPLGESQEAHY